MKPSHGVGLLYNPQIDPRTAFLGTCFLIRDGETVMTAAHCIEGLDTDQLCVAMPFSAAAGIGFDVTQVWHHPESDVALLRIDTTGIDATLYPYGIQGKLHFAGEGVVAMGFARESKADGDFDYPLRRFTGNLQRWCMFAGHDPPFSALELSFPSPKGLSGGPLFSQTDHTNVVGLMCNNHVARIAERVENEYEDEEGRHVIEKVARFIEYGIAVNLNEMRDWLEVPWADLRD